MTARQQPGIGGHAVALGQNDHVAPHHVTPGDALAQAVADHQRPRAGQVAQRLEHALGPGFLDHGDGDRQPGKDQQDQGFGPVAKRQIDQPPGQQQREHRLFQHIQNQPERAAPFGTGQGVRPLGGKPLRCFQGGQSVGQIGRAHRMGLSSVRQSAVYHTAPH